MVKLFTHTDLDGVGCAILARLAFGVDVDITYCNYDEVNDLVSDYTQTELLTDDVCHITDISVSEKIAKDIENNSSQFYLMDHHPTALELNKYDWCNVVITDEETGFKTSGTEMYYKWLVKNGYLSDEVFIRNFVELVRNYDTWRWSELGEEGIVCKQLNDLYYLYGKDKFIMWAISEIYDEVFPKFYADDKLVLDMKQKEIDEYVETKDKQIITLNLLGYRCGFVFAERFFSELGNRLCKLHPEIDFIAMIDMDGTVSYRTVKENIDLGKNIAKLYGGGGHPKAAGSQFGHEVKKRILDEIFGRI